MVRRLATGFLLAAAFAAPAAAAPPVELMPGVTYAKTVQFTPHGAVVLHVITAPRPGSQNGLYALGPALASTTLTGALGPVTGIEQQLSSTATVAGINGDAFSGAAAPPAGVVMQGGVLEHPPLSGRSSIGVDAAGQLHVDRLSFVGTWRGTGQRRPLTGLNQVPKAGQVSLFTPAYGARAPVVAGTAEVVLSPFPASVPNTDLTATVSSLTTGGGDVIPPGGAVLMATGITSPKLQTEAPVGTSITVRLILQPSWAGMVSALGGGPVLVRESKPVFRSLEDFTNDQVTKRDPRAGVGQLADGRVILVAVDGDRPGYSVGLTSYELAQAMVRLGAVSASAVDSGDSVTVAFDGKLLNRPSGVGGERAVKEALLVQYFGVYAPPPALPLVNGDPSAVQQTLSYKLVRPSTVTAELIGPDKVPRVIESAVHHDPGVYTFPYSTFDSEGDWQWTVSATDDLGRASTASRSFRYDTTLQGLSVPKVAHGTAAIRFTLSRPASVKLQIETKTGVAIRTLPAVSLPVGSQSVVWDGRLPGGSLAYGGAYVAHLFVTSSSGTSELTATFGFRR